MKKGALFRGYAYVTFVEKGSIETALLRDRNQIEGRPAFITKHVDKDSVEKKKGMLSILNEKHHDHIFFFTLHRSSIDDFVTGVMSSVKPFKSKNRDTVALGGSNRALKKV